VLENSLVSDWTERLRQEPSAAAVLLVGSHARGVAGPYSDLDLTLLTKEVPADRYRAIFVEQAEDQLLHVSVLAMQWEEWVAMYRKPASWSFSLPAARAVRVLWADDAVRSQLAGVAGTNPAGPIELEDFVECACKVKNAHAAGDELALRLAAQDLARLCPSVLQPINTVPEVRTRPEALRVALDLAVAPAGYREDMLVCLGLTGRQISTDRVRESALHLAVGVVDLLAAYGGEPQLPLYLRDGRLRRYLEQTVGDSS
jgi:phosphoribosyl-AMP cyclohydrolase